MPSASTSTPGQDKRAESGGLILASTSRYRAELLSRLQVPFHTDRPQVDESAHAGEAPEALARRLAWAKAADVAARHPQQWVIGSDQVASLHGQALGKPGTREAQRAQLHAQSAQAVTFYTAVTVISAQGQCLHACDTTVVRFRPLSAAQIEHYIEHEPATDCAGGFKCEGLGITLFDAIDSQDPTALVGLPLIATWRLLTQAGYSSACA